MAEDTNHSYGLVVAFPDQSPSFTHGFEAGQVWQELCSATESDEEINKTLHKENHELFVRFGLELGWIVEFETTEYKEWENVKFSRGFKQLDRPNPYGLRVIQ